MLYVLDYDVTTVLAKVSDMATYVVCRFRLKVKNVASGCRKVLYSATATVNVLKSNPSKIELHCTFGTEFREFENSLHIIYYHFINPKFHSGCQC